MSVSGLSEREIDNFTRNYVDRGMNVGGKFALAEPKLEKMRRVKYPFSPKETAKVIVEHAKKSPVGLVTYKQIWEVFRPGAIWIGNAPRSEMAKVLAAVIVYCVDNKLPILSTLVVRANPRNHSEKAIVNIYNEAKSLGLEAGSDAHLFVKNQQDIALNLTHDMLG